MYSRPRDGRSARKGNRAAVDRNGGVVHPIALHVYAVVIAGIGIESTRANGEDTIDRYGIGQSDSTRFGKGYIV